MAAPTREEAFRHCVRVARASGSNFVLAFRTLPRAMFDDMCALYAFMRRTDDLADEDHIPLAQREIALGSWSEQLNRALRGESVDESILIAVADVAQRAMIPAEELQEVISGVRADLIPRRFKTFADLEGYCYQVAGVVGLACLRIWGYSGELPREAAIACGTAFQLTNILRDLREDALQGRIYLPLEDLARFDVHPDWLTETSPRPEVAALLRYEVELAWNFYVQALDLLDHLQPGGQRILGMFIELYATILREIERREFNVQSRRITLPRWKKLSVLCRCLLRRPSNPRRLIARDATSVTAASR